MQQVYQFLVHTPWWVYAVFVYLIVRGVRAMQPGNTTLVKVAIIPVVFTILGVSELVRVYGLAPDAIGIWVVGLVIGAVIGFLILRTAAISVDRATGIIHRPADMTLLPLVILIFAVKYTFGVIGALSPALLLEPSFRFADLGLSGLFTGVFIGKFAVYIFRYASAQPSIAKS